MNRNTHVAREAGADGVFLINHGISDVKLFHNHAEVADSHPGCAIFRTKRHEISRGPAEFRKIFRNLPSCPRLSC